MEEINGLDRGDLTDALTNTCLRTRTPKGTLVLEITFEVSFTDWYHDIFAALQRRRQIFGIGYR